MTWRSTWASSGPPAKSTPGQNGTFGLAAITKDHVTVTKGQLVFEYLAKGSQQHEQVVAEEQVCAVCGACDGGAATGTSCWPTGPARAGMMSPVLRFGCFALLPARRLIEEEMRRGGHRTATGRPVCQVH